MVRTSGASSDAGAEGSASSNARERGSAEAQRRPCRAMDSALEGVAVDVRLAGDEAEPLVEPVGRLPTSGATSGRPCGRRRPRLLQRGPVERLADAVTAGIDVDDDVLDPRPAPRRATGTTPRVRLPTIRPSSLASRSNVAGEAMISPTSAAVGGAADDENCGSSRTIASTTSGVARSASSIVMSAMGRTVAGPPSRARSAARRPGRRPTARRHLPVTEVSPG